MVPEAQSAGDAQQLHGSISLTAERGRAAVAVRRSSSIATINRIGNDKLGRDAAEWSSHGFASAIWRRCQG